MPCDFLRKVRAFPVSKCTCRVQQALNRESWLQDFGHGLPVPVIWEFLQLWDAVHAVQLLSGEADVRTSGNRLPQALSRPNRLYLSFFTGSTKFRSHKRLWKSWASLCAKLFLWLAIMDRRWTADRLARRGRPHPESCPLCDQAAESIQHLLINCVVSREVWFHALAKVGLQNIAPMLQEDDLQNWWRRAERRVPAERKKGFNNQHPGHSRCLVHLET